MTGVIYKSTSNATLATVLTFLNVQNIGSNRIVNILYDSDASVYVAIYVDA